MVYKSYHMSKTLSKPYENSTYSSNLMQIPELCWLRTAWALDPLAQGHGFHEVFLNNFKGSEQKAVSHLKPMALRSCLSITSLYIFAIL